MGKQHGSQIASLVRAAVNQAGSIITGSHQMSDAKLQGLVDYHKEITKNLRPEQFEELRGVAEGAGVDYARLLELFLARELPYGFHDMPQSASCVAEECTAWAAAGEATKEPEPLLAQNRDCLYDSGEYRIVIIAQPYGKQSFVATGRVGSNDGYGVNKEGLAIMAPAVRPSDSITAANNHQPPGIQSYTLARMILETCETVREAVDLVRHTPPGYMGLNWLIIDRDNHIAKVERSYGRVNVTLPEASDSANKVIAATNHYSSKEMMSLNTSIGGSTRKRYDRISTLLTMKAGKLDFDAFLELARDHHNGPGELSICNHGQEYGTNLSMIAQPMVPRLSVLRGSPCLNDFVEYDCP
jgi:isopenicillin-N N-acyltransferase-like protein